MYLHQEESGGGPSTLPLWGPIWSTASQAWGPHHKKDVELLQQVQKRAMKMIKGLEHMHYEKSLRELCLKKRKLRGDLISVFQYLKEAYKHEGDQLFTVQ